MADGMFNIARGRSQQLLGSGLGANDIEIVLLKAAEADDTLNNYDDLSTLLGAAGNTEADFTNYARKSVVNASITVTVDDANNRLTVDIADQTWATAGNGTNNSLVKLIVCIVLGAGDANRLPFTHHDFVVTTDGSDLTAQIPTSPDAFYQST